MSTSQRPGLKYGTTVGEPKLRSMGSVVLISRRRHPAAPVIAGATLVMLLMHPLAMLTVTPVALAGGLGTDPKTVAQLVAFTVIFTVLGAVEIWLLVLSSQRMHMVNPAWLRSVWWPEPDIACGDF